MDELDATAVTETNSETLTPNDAGEGAAAPADWTIMIYQASDNDLAEYDVRQLKELKDIQTGDQIHIIAQLDPSNKRMGTRRIVINRKQKTVVKVPAATTTAAQAGASQLADDSVNPVPGTIKFSGRGQSVAAPSGQSGTGSAVPAATTPGSGMPGPDMTKPETLFDFISWSQENYPAKHYMLVLSGHAAGMESGFLLKDHNPPRSMSFTDLLLVLNQVKSKLQIPDIIGMDSCLMSMVEICFQLRGLAGILVGAQSQIPQAGLPYAQVVDDLKTAGNLKPEDLASLIVEKYIDFNLDNSVVGGLAVDLGALRIDASEGVAAALKALTGVLAGELDKLAFKDAIVLSHWDAQSYNGELYLDLFDFCDLLKERYSDTDVPKKCQDVQDAISNMVIKSCFCGIDYQYSNGLSIYFPWSEIYSGYSDLEFPRDEVSGWGKFLLAYVNKTRRKPRGAPASPGYLMLFDFRDDPPYKGPAGSQSPGPTVHSMRNPPNKYPDIGVTSCVKDKEQFKQFIEPFTLQ